jgi:hypothetical protein
LKSVWPHPRGWIEIPAAWQTAQWIETRLTYLAPVWIETAIVLTLAAGLKRESDLGKPMD